MDQWIGNGGSNEKLSNEQCNVNMYVLDPLVSICKMNANNSLIRLHRLVFNRIDKSMT